MDGGSGDGDIASFATDVGAGKDGGVKVSLAEHKARGDGHDRLFRFESIEGSAFDDILVGDKQANVIDGGPGNDTIIGGGGHDELNGGQGTDGCKGAKGRTVSCGKEKQLKASAYVEVDATRGGGGGLELIGLGGPDHFTVAFDPYTDVLGVSRQEGDRGRRRLRRTAAARPRSLCPFNGPARWLTADLGPGNDRLTVEGSLAAIGTVRFAGGLGDDTIKGGPEDDLIEAGFGADRLYGGAGADGLIGSTPGPDLPLRRARAATCWRPGGGCAGGRAGRRPRPRRRLLRRDPGAPGPALRLLPAAQSLDRRGPGLPPGAPLAYRRGHGGVLRQRRPDRRRRAEQHPRPARRRPHLRRRRRRHARRPRRRPRRSHPVRPAERGHTVHGRRGQRPATPGPARAATPSSTPSTRTPVGCAEVTFGHPVPGLGKTEEHHPSQ